MTATTASTAVTSPAVHVLVDPAAVVRRQEAGDHAYGLQALEALDHLRLAYGQWSPGQPLPPTGVLLIAEADTLAPEDLTAITAWVENGGQLVVTAAVPTLAELAGVDATERGQGLVAFDAAQWSQSAPRALRALGGHALQPGDGVEVLAHWEDTPQAAAAITRREHGSGTVTCFGVDLWQSVVRILQGYPVLEDHAPAADGSAPMDEGVLKAEDGMALDVDHDRRTPPGEPEVDGQYPFGYPPPYGPPIFDLPQADLWVSALAQTLWTGLDRTAGAHGWVHYWPAGVPAMGHMSHDSDGNDDADGQAALDSFAEAGVAVTWCQVYRDNAYSQHIYDQITADGHEHALHYNAMDDADIAQWGWEQIQGQYAWAQKVTGVERIRSNKNHYTRWENWTEFYEWCEKLGIEIDESRGPSKLGTVGFTFGTAHVDFPMGEVALGNRRMNVLNLPLHTQDLGHAGHPSCRDVIFDGAESVHGVAHFLYHGPHLREKPYVRRTCAEVAELGRQRGMRWWTAGQINDWERARREVQVQVEPQEQGWQVTVTSSVDLSEVGLVLHLGEQTGAVTATTADGVSAPVTEVSRHGRRWYELGADVRQGTVVWQVVPA
ncbi:MAG TPA: hypothetical protein IAA98_05555 [Candidatus Avipropionibacterium avicola]|uniref:Uncharacterized protein n=1 Tax=Candidatus Avipropionibacterium avicola TaxID=2840701 RepID=A0A9D1KMR7_9ACTN|nr:hypothetical protein [Candidatus Avipropionibacterium avicola]